MAARQGSRASSWSTQTGYDPSKFYLASTDGKGHGTTIKAQLPPELLSVIAALVQSGRFPYKTTADFIRDSLCHRLAYIHEENELEKMDLVGAMMAMSKLQLAQYELTALKNMVERGRTAVESAIAAKDETMLRQVLGTLDVAMAELRDPYREQMEEARQRAQKELSAMLRARKGAKVTKLHAVGDE